MLAGRALKPWVAYHRGLAANDPELRQGHRFGAILEIELDRHSAFETIEGGPPRYWSPCGALHPGR